MSRIQEAFKGKKAFIPFVTCGAPDLETTKQIVYEMEKAGAALIELGIPFSDPTAEGPVIQGANLRALTGGVTTDKIFDMVKEIRQNTQIPLVFMTYANVVFSYGTERFLEKAKNVGMDGLILPDVPFEEKEEFDNVCKKYGINEIRSIPDDCKRSIGIRILCFLTWCNRNKICDHDGYRSNGEARKRGKRYSMCGRIRNLHSGAGGEDVSERRWCDRWKCNR